MSVDLPAPLSPRSASTSPARDVEVHAVEREHGTEPLGRAAHGDDAGLAVPDAGRRGSIGRHGGVVSLTLAPPAARATATRGRSA